MTIACSKCKGATREKAITTKFGPTTVGECLGGCLNDKGYPLGTFAKRGGSAPSGAHTPQPQIGVAADMLQEIKRSNILLEEMKALLCKIAFPKGVKPLAIVEPNQDVDDIDDQLEPDSDVPF